jgi:glycosyltransferase involved in cell wall biosynthesis
MKAIIIGPAYPYRGGIADTNESLCRELQKQGYQTELYTFKFQYPNFLFPGKTQFSIDPKPSDLKIKRIIHSLNPINWIRIGLRIREIKPEIVIIRYWIPFLSPCFGTIAKFISKETTIIGLCDNILPHEKRMGDKLLTKYFTNNCDSFIAMSRTVREDLSQFSNKKCLYLPHPINDGLGDIINKEIARKYLELSQDKNYLLFFGLIRDYKGLDLLLQSIPYLKDDIHLIVAGEFYSNPEKYYSLVKELGIENKVTFTNKFVAKEDIPFYFCACDMVTQTYKTATQSGVTQIAYHFHKPMLVTNVGGLSEIVPHGRVGYVTNKEPLQIAQAINSFYTDEKEQEFTQNIIIEKEKYSWNNFVKELLSLQH